MIIIDSLLQFNFFLSGEVQENLSLFVNWRFAFGWRVVNARTAVVSTARMSLHYKGEPFWGTSVKVRMRKIVTKDIGILYYGLSQSDNPKSVLYNSILGIQELDKVGEGF